MIGTALCGADDEQLQPGCWCCGDSTVCGGLLRLAGHPDVGVCFRCVDVLAKRKRRMERMTSAAPPGPWWRRLRHRAEFGHC